MTTTESPRWYKSSYSNNGGQCIEVATNHATSHGAIPVRDSKNVGGATLTFRTDTFATFISGIRNSTI